MKPALLVDVLRDPCRIDAFIARDWELLLSQARAAGLHGALPFLLDDAGVDVPPAPREHLDWLRTEALRHRDSMRNEVRLIAQALAQGGRRAEPLLLLKGAAYLMADLPLARGRLFGDVDILVPKIDLQAVERALVLHGWACTKQDAYDQRYYREWMHELPPMKHLHRGSSIDVHHAILPETAASRPDPDLLRAAALPIPGADGLWMLAPQDMLLHSAVHLFSESEMEHGLRGLLDIHRLLSHFGGDPGFWEGLPERARQLQLTRPLFYALRYSSRLLGSTVPVATLAEAARLGQPGTWLLRLMDALFMRALLPPHASCADGATPAALKALYLRGNWLRMPPVMLARHLFHKAFISGLKQEDVV
ncbi:nucleotidyltransferase domain-containing protein [Massilia alkalitolerans]|uniref:nucleotidyltransferase domain-containing protein n=1 Tax=Massilia alkalitolerans TaxID=286638 RepID=UPI0028A99C9B|nr:nucleotidyltransferase family protein [Massilia alkalitolerans]